MGDGLCYCIHGIMRIISSNETEAKFFTLYPYSQLCTHRAWFAKEHSACRKLFRKFQTFVVFGRLPVINEFLLGEQTASLPALNNSIHELYLVALWSWGCHVAGFSCILFCKRVFVSVCQCVFVRHWNCCPLGALMLRQNPTHTIQISQIESAHPMTEIWICIVHVRMLVVETFNRRYDSKYMLLIKPVLLIPPDCHDATTRCIN